MSEIKQTIDVSIIIPAKDEEKRLPGFLDSVIAYCQRSSKEYEIIVVDDGSTDGTDKVVQNRFNLFSHLRLIRNEKNTGKGFAVKCGFLKARGEIVLFMDADGSTAPEAIEKNLKYFEQGFDIVIGSRVLRDDEHMITARWYRKLIGQVFNGLVHRVLFQEIKDSQCGFKMFKKNTIEPLFSKMKILEFGFDLEVLFIAFQLGFKIKEVPVRWTHMDGSRLNLFSASTLMFLNIFQIRLWHSKLKSFKVG